MKRGRFPPTSSSSVDVVLVVGDVSLAGAHEPCSMTRKTDETIAPFVYVTRTGAWIQRPGPSSPTGRAWPWIFRMLFSMFARARL